jgi:predicted dehydrogenase
VLCEKPLATTLEDCDRIARAVARSGITFMQSFPKRFDPVNHELRRMVQEGELGRLSMVRVRHGHFHCLDSEFVKQWYLNPDLAGGGTLLEEGVHGADFLRWLLGEPESVSATIAGEALGLRVEDAAVAVFRFPGGVLGELATSYSFTAADNSVELYGTGGTAVVSAVDLASRDITREAFVKIFRVGQAERRWTISPIVPRFKTGGFHQQNALHFLEALARGMPPSITLEDGRRAVEMILAAYAAARTGRTQEIAAPSPDYSRRTRE